MKYPRFRVATCEGYRISENRPGVTGGNAKPGLSATVCDALHGWREVRTYRSEDRGLFGGVLGVRGRERALADAETHAAYLNRLYRTAQHRATVRAGRARVNGG